MRTEKEEKELSGILGELQEQGWEPRVCDTMVPYFANGVPAGYPESPGDYDGDYVMIPKGLLKDCDFIVAVRGDSMKDLNIESGDEVIVKQLDDYADGDVLVVYLDGETTLKSYCVYEGEGWLIPANDAYRPLRLADYQSVYILGKVTGVKKASPRMSFSDIQKKMKNVKKQPLTITDKDLRYAIGRVLDDIKVGRMWFCIYSVLTEPEIGVLRHGEYDKLKELVDRLFPGNDFDISSRNISVMDVDSFKRSFRLWNDFNAPVAGKRFRDYYNLAVSFYDYLTK